MSKLTSLTKFELETKVASVILEETQKGRQASDFSRKEIVAISDKARSTLSPAARQLAIEEGLQVMVKRVMGEMIAAEVWAAGTGWPKSRSEVDAIAERLKFSDGFECLEAYREHLPDLTFEELGDFEMTGRFAPLFIGQPADASLGEIATVKAMRGDKLALSFLAWKEIQ